MIRYLSFMLYDLQLLLIPKIVMISKHNALNILAEHLTDQIYGRNVTAQGILRSMTMHLYKHQKLHDS